MAAKQVLTGSKGKRAALAFVAALAVVGVCGACWFAGQTGAAPFSSGQETADQAAAYAGPREEAPVASDGKQPASPESGASNGAAGEARNGAFGDAWASDSFDAENGASYAPNQVVIQLQSGATQEDAQQLVQRLPYLQEESASLSGAGTSTPFLTVKIAEGTTVDRVLESISAEPEVESAQKNYRYRLMNTPGAAADADAAADAPSATVPTAAQPELLASARAVYPNDPDRAQQWYLDAIGAYDAWSVATSDQRVSVAVIDSGIDMNHPDLKDNIVAPYDVVGDARTDATPSVPDESPDDELGHGTHVAGIACGVANNSTGIAGVSYNANVLPIKVFYYSALSRGYVAETADIAAAFNYVLGDAGDGSGQTIAQKYNVRVINMSLGSVWEDDATGEEDQLFLDLIDRADAAGILVVCAAGNDDAPLPYKSFPSDYETCVSVIALADASTKASFSNYGPEKDIAAPGSRILSTVPLSYSTTGYAYMDGTSMASPVVAGSAALLFAANPSLTTDQAKQVLYATAVDLGAPGKDNDFGHGALDLNAAVSVAQGVSTTPVSSIGGFPTQGEVGQPLALYATVRPAEANQNVIFTVKDAGVTGVALSGGRALASHEGTATFCATVVGGAADGSNYVQEFDVYFAGSDQGVWNGTADVSWYDPAQAAFELATPEQLAGLAALVNGTAVDAQGEALPRTTFAGKTVRLTSDMYFNEASVDKRTDGMRQWVPIGDVNAADGQAAETFFDGMFEGQGHILYNLYLDGAQSAGEYGGYQGLFGALGQHAVVANVGLEGGWIFGRVAGGIAAVSHVETAGQLPHITGCFNGATIEGYGSSSRGTGGIFGGENQANEARASVEAGAAPAPDAEAGAAPAAADAAPAATDAAPTYRAACRISNCYNRGTIRGYVGGPAGGIAGIGSVEITSCYNAGTVVSQGAYVGSIVGTLIAAGSSAVPAAVPNFTAGGQVSASFGLAGSCANLYRYLDDQHPHTDSAAIVTENLLSSEELKAASVRLGSAYVDNAEGFPLLYWQAGVARTDISAAVVDAIADQLYTGAPVVPSITVRLASASVADGQIVLQPGSDYTVTCENNTEVGTARLTVQGTGRYTGLVQTTFQVVKVNLEQCAIAVPAAQWYTGNALDVDVTVTAPGGVLLRAGRDYTISVELSSEGTFATVAVAGACAGVEGAWETTMQLVAVSERLQGAGTQEDPYLISSKADLQFMANALNGAKAGYAQAHYKLTCDIVAASTPESALAVDPLGVGENGFGGTFDGGGHTITLGLSAQGVSKDAGFDANFNSLALFPTVRDRGLNNPVRISNLVLDGQVSSTGNAAAFAGAVLASEVQFDSCENRATVTCGTDMTGAGFVAYTGMNTRLVMSNCANKGSISGGYYLAGLVGELAGAGRNQFSACSNQGAIQSNGHAGGLVCSFEPSAENSFSMMQCYNAGEVVSSGTGGACSAGGLLAFSQPDANLSFASCSVVSCYNAGAVSARYAAGGLVGRLYYLPVDFGGVYNTATVSCTNGNRSDVAARPGGLVGMVAYEGRWSFSSAYNAGALESAAGLESGGLVGWAFYGTTLSFDHACYRADTASSAVSYGTLLKPLPAIQGVPQGISPDEMTVLGQQGFAAQLGSSFVDDAPAPDGALINEGRPVLFWQAGAGKLSLESPDVSVEAPGAQPYTGLPVTPHVVVRAGENVLVEGADYALSYENNVARSTQALVHIRGIGRYESTLTCAFEIGKGDIARCAAKSIPDQFLVEGRACPQVTLVNEAGTTLVEGSDYEVTYANNTSATDQAQAIVTGAGNYEGQQTVFFTIVEQKMITPAHVSTPTARQYTGQALEPAVTVAVDGQQLVRDQDYSLLYANNVEVGQASIVVTGMNRYFGAVTVNFDIVAADLGAARIEPIAQQQYTGQPVCPPLEVWCNGSKVPESGYTASYYNNVAVGMASVTITGQGNYRGTRSANFLIVPESTEQPDPMPGPGDGMWEGKGTAASPYLINNAEDLEALSRAVFDAASYTGQSFSGVHFRVTNDITPDGGLELTPIGYSANYPFSGVFDGGGHEIALNIRPGSSNAGSSNGTGLFGYVSGSADAPAQIRDVVITGEVSSAYSYVGAVCGQAKGQVSIERCINAATVSSAKSFIGGILGSTADAAGCVSVRCCGNYGQIASSNASADAFVGGIVGRMHATKEETPSELAFCYNQGSIAAAGGLVGGIAGGLHNAPSATCPLVVSGCYNTGSVATTQQQQEAGALFGGTYLYGGGNAQALVISRCFYDEQTAAAALSPTVYAGAYVTEGTFTWEDASSAPMTAQDMGTDDFVALLGDPFVAGNPYPVIGRACKAVFRIQPQSASYSLADAFEVLPLQVSVDVPDGSAVTYQWYRVGEADSAREMIEGATAASYQPDLPQDEAGAYQCGTWRYCCVVTDEQGAQVSSQVATITVWNGQAAAQPVFTADVQDVTVTQGAPAFLQVAAQVTDGGQISYQWYVLGDDGNAAAVPCATDQRLELDTSALGTQRYYCVATNTSQIETNTAQARSSVCAVTVCAYAVSTAEELRAFADEVNAGTTFEGLTVQLGADIDLASEPFTPIGSPENPFKGTFDGGGHRIVGLALAQENDCALFGAISGSSSWEKDHAAIRNLLVFGQVKATGARVAALCANAHWATLENVGSFVDVSSTATTDESCVAGLIGRCEEASTITLEGCFSAGAVSSAGARVGGLIGDAVNSQTSIANCFVTGSVTGAAQVGGLVGTSSFAGGWLRPVAFSSCYVSGAVAAAAEPGAAALEAAAAPATETAPATAADAATVGGFMGTAPAYYGTSAVTVSNCLQSTGAASAAFGQATGVVGQVRLLDPYDLQHAAQDLGGAFCTDNYSLHNGFPALSWENAPRPYISRQPQGAVCLQGEQAAPLVVEAHPFGTQGAGTNAARLTYQWYCSNTLDARGSALPGATEPVLENIDTAALGTLYYSCLVTEEPADASSAALSPSAAARTASQSETPAQTWSLAARVVVCQAAQAPLVDVSACEVQAIAGMAGASVSALAASPDGGSLAYQWYRANSAQDEGYALAGQTDATLAQFGTQPGTFYVYCVVSNTLAAVENTAYAQSPRVKVTVKPLEIATAQDYLDFAAAVNAGTSFEGCTVRLAASLDLRSVAGMVPVGTQDNPFLGTFEGGNNTIALALSGTNTTALFGCAGSASTCAVIENLLVDGMVSATGNNTAAVVAWGRNVLLRNVGSFAGITVTGAGSATAGLVGGAPAGERASITLQRCFNAGPVTSAGYDAAGLVGAVYNSMSTVSLSDCYNTGTIKAASFAGGLYGGDDYYTPQLFFERCYNAAAVQKTGKYGVAGALCGYIPATASAACARDCFFVDSLCGVAAGAGALDATALSAAQLAALPAALNESGAYRAATSTAEEQLNGGYPLLRWQLEPDTSGVLGDINNNGRVNIVDAQLIYDLARNAPGLWDAILAHYPETATEASIAWIADVNQDGAIDAADAFAVQAACALLQR